MNLIKEILRGVMIGVANIIPGVSGGTMAVSMGIYDKMIYAVNHLRTELKKSVLTLLPYLIGMVLGIGVLSFVIGFLFQEYPYQTSMGFIGLILGGVPAIWSSIQEGNSSERENFSGKENSSGKGNFSGKRRAGIQHLSAAHVLILLLFFAGIILLELFGGGEEQAAVLEPGIGMAIKLFLVGILASATMVIPGVSGSMILMLLGFYTPILEQIQSFIKAGLALEVPALLSGAAILVPFGIGVIVGIVLIAKLIGYLLEHFRFYTYMGILGLVFASPVVVFLQMEAGHIGILAGIVGVLCLLLGLLVANGMSERKN